MDLEVREERVWGEREKSDEFHFFRKMVVVSVDISHHSALQQGNIHLVDEEEKKIIANKKDKNCAFVCNRTILAHTDDSHPSRRCAVCRRRCTRQSCRRCFLWTAASPCGPRSHSASTGASRAVFGRGWKVRGVGEG